MTLTEYITKETEQINKEIETLHERLNNKLIQMIKNKRENKQTNLEEIKYIKTQIRKREERIRQLGKKK